MIHERFKTYFKERFFKNNPPEFQEFLESLEKPILRSIRIRPGKEKVVKGRLENDGWILGNTPIENVFTLDRREDFNPLERRIGFSMDHLIGNFYIQELAAAHPVSILANGKIQNDAFLILDMASSPGGKTTQLAEYYPGSFIIANEPTRERIPQLLQNLDRMGSANIGVTLYPGQYWKKFPETFDRILLDAPCSGEGTLYKGTDAAKHWHIKNIKNIASLQTKLFDAAIHALKVGGEMIYSTCSMNDLEDEGVLESMKKKYPECFEILYEKKFWPHKDKTGGFYVVKIRKVQSLENEARHLEESPNRDLERYSRNIAPWVPAENIELYEHTGKILAIKNEKIVRHLLDTVYFMRFGEQVGSITGNNFIPNTRSYRYLNGKTLHHKINNEEILDSYFRGMEIATSGLNEGWTDIIYDGEIISREWSEGGNIINNLPPEWKRI